MDRRSQNSKAARIELSSSLPWSLELIVPEWSDGSGSQPRSRRPSRVRPVLGRFGFFSGGIAVIATASLLALHIN